MKRFGRTLILTCTVIICGPTSGWAETSKRQSLRNRYQQKNILLNAPTNERWERAEREVSQMIAPQMSAPQGDSGGDRIDSQRGANLAAGAIIRPTIVEYAIYQTDYQAEIEEEIAFIKEQVELEVFQKGGLTKIPLVNSDVGLKEVSLNRKPSIVNREGQHYFLLVSKPGRYHLDLEFFVKVSREREHGPGRFSFEAFPSPISLLDVQISEPDMDIMVEPSIKIEKETTGNKTLATVVLPYTQQVSIRWNPAVGKVELPSVKLEPKLYADVATLVSIGEGVAHCLSRLRYSILQSEISNFKILLPDDIAVLDVQGTDLRDWKMVTYEGRPLLDVYLSRGLKGSYELTVNYEKTIGEGSVTAQLPHLQVVGVEREEGMVGVQAQTSVEITFDQLEGATPVDVKELPSELWNRAAYPILLAYKYLKHPVTATVNVVKHHELSVLVATIDSAHYVTLVTREGKLLTKATLNTRNNVKQFMRLRLPEGATLLNCFVSGKPVKPAQDKEGQVLIPLEKSESLGETVAQFPVELMYLMDRAPLQWTGQLRVLLPGIDIPTSQLYWSAYLPEEFNYGFFRGDAKLLRSPQLVAPMLIGAGRAQEAVSTVSGSLMKSHLALEQRAYGEFKAGYVQGALPIRIDMPTVGRLYRFSKLLVTDERPWFSCTYLRNFSEAREWWRWLVFLLVVGVFVAIGQGASRSTGRRIQLMLSGLGILLGMWLGRVEWWVVLGGLAVAGIARISMGISGRRKVS